MTPRGRGAMADPVSRNARAATPEAPVARSPLDHLADMLATAGGPDVALRELPFLAQVGLRADPAEVDAATLGLPTAPNTVAARDDGGRTLWLGPREWLVVGEPGTAAA